MEGGLETLRNLSELRKQGDALNSLTQVLLQDDDSAVRALAAVNLGDLGGEQAVAVLAAAVMDRDLSVRRNAIRGLGMNGGAEAAQALGVSERTLRKWMRDGGLPYLRRDGIVLIPRAGLEDWLLDQVGSSSDTDELAREILRDL